MIRFILPAITTAVALLASAAVFADEPEPTLFVVTSGSDSGNCQDPASPCRSIDYALKRVGKNGQVRIGAGSFRLTAAEDIVYLLSGAIDVRGGYPAGAKTTLVGVPHEYASELSKKGFHVIADTKGVSDERLASNRKIVQTQQILTASAAATPCVGGLAGVFPCNNVDLLAHVANRTPAARGADIWGFVDLNTNREYAIVGYSSGTAVFDVTDAENPREVGFINGQSTTWRDMKVHQFWNPTDSRWNAYAYIVADGASDGLFIIDLNQLPHSIARVSYSSDFSSAHNVYLTDTDFSTGLSITGESPTLILAGSNLSDGRFRSYSLANPASPSFIAAPSTPPGQAGNDRLYMHDAASMIVTDARKDSQCVNAGGSDHCDVLFDFNESTVDIWDVTNTSAPVRLSQTPYLNADYVHSGWWSEDQQFLFVQDELDERDLGLLTTLRVFSISNLAAPTLAGSWTGLTTAIDHNGFVRGNRYYMSNYARGLSIIDITNAANPELVGRFDTFPASDNVGFPGNWGVYPYLPSGNIALSDIDSGFYLVTDNTLNIFPQGSLSFTANAYGGDETQAIDIVVQRSGGSQGAASVRWEVLAASGSFDDVTTRSGTLNWADGDGADRTINLVPDNDGNAEGIERLLVRLTSPTGGATLSAPNITSAYISDAGAASSIEFSASDISLPERGFGLAIAVVQRSGSAIGAASVDFNVSANDATQTADFTGPLNGTLNWADGDADPKWIEYQIVDDGAAEADEFLELTLSNASGANIGSGAVLRINILDGSGSNSAPNAVVGSSQTVNVGAVVSLDGSGSNDPDGDTLTYSWSQTLGPGVTLNNATTATATFTAPSVSSDTLLRFTLQVTDPAGQFDSTVASVTVSVGGGPTIGGGGGGGSLSLWLLVGLLGLSIARAATAIQTDAFSRSFARDPVPSR